MPIKNAFWGRRRSLDVHLVRGQTSQTLLTHHLFFVRQDNAVVSAFKYIFDPPAPGDVEVHFIAQIKGHPNGDTFVGPGVEISTLTGSVKVLDPLPPIRLHNFILIAQISRLPDHNVLFTLPLRFHIHDSVSQLWLTPDPLTIRPAATTRPDSTGYRFSVRAQFDDGIVGDLTDNHGVAWACTNPANIDADGFLTLLPGDGFGTQLSVSATLPAAMGSMTLTRQAIIDRPWDDPTRATIIGAGGWPGKAEPNTVPNFLFLCDGYTDTADDREAFETACNSIVNRFKTTHLTAPFDLLTTSINFWRCFIPSPQRGISMQTEVYTMKSDQGDVYGFTVPNALPPPAAGAWEIEHLVYALGLPIPSDARTNAARTDHDIVTDWAVLYTTDPTPHLTTALMNRWRALANRSLVDDLDSALGMAYGTLPQVNSLSDNKLIDFHFNRMTRLRLNQLLATLHADPDFDLTKVWAAEPDQPAPANFELVFVLCMSRWDRAVNLHNQITFSANEDEALEGIATVQGRNAYAWKPPAIPPDISGPRSGRALHEIAHSFGLGDEYADVLVPITLTEKMLEGVGNLQTEPDAQTGGQLDGDQIKWNWFRVGKGAMLTELIEELGVDHWKVHVDIGQGLQFAKGDPVIVRKRVFPKALPKRPIETMTRDPVLGSPIVLTVEASDRDTVTVTGAIADVFAFGEGDTLYAPVPAPASVVTPAYPFAEIIAKNVKDHFNGHHVPLMSAPCDPTKKSGGTLIPDVSLILNLAIGGKDLPTIVGVYHGGSHLPCGVFHPAGTCMMRGDGEFDALTFCAVCRYTLVDVINPFKHFQNDRKYARIYPLK